MEKGKRGARYGDLFPRGCRFFRKRVGRHPLEMRQLWLLLEHCSRVRKVLLLSQDDRRLRVCDDVLQTGYTAILANRIDRDSNDSRVETTKESDNVIESWWVQKEGSLPVGRQRLQFTGNYASLPVQLTVA